jgi:Family of unknown function (DUF5681)
MNAGGPQQPRTPRIRRSHSSSSARYDTGYGKPPEQYRFRPGQSGNPKGRPKGAKNPATLLQDILDRKIEVRTGSTLCKMSVLEAMLTRIAESALKGDTKSAAFLLQRYDTPEAPDEHATNGAAPEEQEIIDAYLKAYLKRGGKKE